MQGVVGSPFSGSKRPADLASSSAALRVRFTSDDVEHAAGFLAILDAAPGGLYSSREYDCTHGESVLAQSSGVLSDGDGDYAPNAACAWTVAPPGAEAVSLVFTRLDTEPDYDTVTVEGCSDSSCSSPVSVPGSPFSGRDLPPVITAHVPVLRVAFASDGRVQRPGFKAAFVGSAMVPCASGDEVPVYGPAALIGDGPGDYSANSDCQWVMERQTGAGPTKLSFLEFETERGFDLVHVEECAEGVVNVRRKADKTKRQQALAKEFE
eukprot:CAMPEP_0196740024 /NCGR_PEP_ID=MMETSP1091-20130531/28394_1 /TAXON_ID=302021 /ORGANISM="Rhodomonas sp., Strain CCMP768" /LENGTH=265 /DNA_ID=CAMNT_0042084925 /DNA_START=40 /DNA_END=837 /DNA_ORIENTATION=+